ncbi:MAG: putative cell division FtsK/SpoIIIE [Parcubacteria group bacterium Gr01-1014_17]|nr:MAG: putative cell division FtsK/SpoIIIE [Parcubacteria group bacterium Gr01-1014_17]
MAKRNKERGWHSIKLETWRGIATVILLALAIFSVLSGIGKAGAVGTVFFNTLSNIFGVAYVLIPLVLLGGGILMLRPSENENMAPIIKIVCLFVFIAGALGLIGLFLPSRGGLAGVSMANFFVSLFDRYASAVILSALTVIPLLIIFNTRFSFSSFVNAWQKIVGIIRPPMRVSDEIADTATVYEQNTDETETHENNAGAAETSEPSIQTDDNGWQPRKSTRLKFGAYEPPPLSILERDQGKPDVGDIKANSNVVKRTLRNFGIEVEMDEVSIGPSVTRYALKPAEGVKLTAIVARQNDLALALAAHSIRIEAPIPGRSLVGIEIPNQARATVRLGALIGSEEFASSDKHLLFALGKSVAGKQHFTNLARMPHLLIAGATGSGKSVAIHTLVASLIYRNSPEALRFMLIDPKRVELTLYNGIPHLLTPVITDAKKAIQALRWAAKEMERRYNILEGESVRDIDSYHKNVFLPAREKADPMPYIVIIIDELADIMSTYPRELEAAVVRLAQMSRAVGIHLVLSTQRPSVNVITGLIKANIPSRIALQVVSQIDSRTILDAAGAEKLLGSGDMLFLSGERSKPERIQSAFISEHEVKKITSYLTNRYPDRGGTELLTPNGNVSSGALEHSFTDSDDVDDDLYEAAKEEVERAGKASTSYLQRKLRVGYARAARIMDILEERGIIGPSDGAKPREIRSGLSQESPLAPTLPEETV